jgi:hypothetical protein
MDIIGFLGLRSKRMKIKVNNCVDCGLPCMLFCPLRDDSWEWHCDECGEETKLYEWEGQELCLDCIEKKLDPIN